MEICLSVCLPLWVMLERLYGAHSRHLWEVRSRYACLYLLRKVRRSVVASLCAVAVLIP